LQNRRMPHAAYGTPPIGAVFRPEFEGDDSQRPVCAREPLQNARRSGPPQDHAWLRFQVRPPPSLHALPSCQGPRALRPCGGCATFVRRKRGLAESIRCLQPCPWSALAWVSSVLEAGDGGRREGGVGVGVNGGKGGRVKGWRRRGDEACGVHRSERGAIPSLLDRLAVSARGIQYACSPNTLLNFADTCASR
jgi:hypothetical protein